MGQNQDAETDHVTGNRELTVLDKQEKEQLIKVRDGKPEDVNFIFATWLRGLRYGNEWFHAIEQDRYYASYHKVIQSILTRPNVRVKVACLKEDEDVVLGYAVHENDKLHWVHVKSTWRNIGIAKDLVPATVTTVTNITKVGVKIALNKKLIFDPFFT